MKMRVLFEFIQCVTLDVYKTIGVLPRYFALLARARRRYLRLALVEAERLDRIRNPAKYLGK